ncbi:MAG: ATP-binding protein [Caldisericia bacterium]|nr:ATP-binding protein [Caldisericia bacterium]
MIPRILQKKVEEKLFKGKAILIFGARQVGKTTLVKSILQNNENEVAFLNGDEPDVREMFTNATSTYMKTIFGKKKIIFIDEAQRIKNIGITLKLIVDQIPEVQVIATGSSAFELGNKTIEPLTGRKFIYTLFPMSFSEMVNYSGILEETRLLKHRLVYGYYPEIVTKAGQESELLHLLSESYLYKDIYRLNGIMKPEVLEKIVCALSLQIGSEVSFNEIANLVGVDRATVVKYIGLLEQAYVVYKIPSFSRNVRNEIRKGKKIYFHDTGIRNAVINSLWKIENRQDLGGLWENYLISERRKLLSYSDSYCKQYFWRTTQQQEIDYIEDDKNGIRAYEFKWNKNAKLKISKTFSSSYPEAKVKLVTPKNYMQFLTDLKF